MIVIVPPRLLASSTPSPPTPRTENLSSVLNRPYLLHINLFASQESDESGSDNSEQNVSTNSQNFTGHHPHHERRQNQNNRFAEEKAKTEATKLVPALNAFPFYANPFLNASTQVSLNG